VTAAEPCPLCHQPGHTAKQCRLYPEFVRFAHLLCQIYGVDVRRPIARVRPPDLAPRKEKIA
jgi:hypothetical protein